MQPDREFSRETDGAHDAAWRARRRQVADLVCALYEGRITSTQFFTEVDGLETRGDAELRELLDLMREEPARSWFFGVGRTTHEDNARRIRELVERMRR